jgi:hypothetical protein
MISRRRPVKFSMDITSRQRVEYSIAWAISEPETRRDRRVAHRGVVSGAGRRRRVVVGSREAASPAPNAAGGPAGMPRSSAFAHPPVAKIRGFG